MTRGAIDGLDDDFVVGMRLGDLAMTADTRLFAVAGGQISGLIDKDRGAGSVGVFLRKIGVTVTEQAIGDRDGGLFGEGCGRGGKGDLGAEAEDEGW